MTGYSLFAFTLPKVQTMAIFAHKNNSEFSIPHSTIDPTQTGPIEASIAALHGKEAEEYMPPSPRMHQLRIRQRWEIQNTLYVICLDVVYPRVWSSLPFQSSFPNSSAL